MTISYNTHCINPYIVRLTTCSWHLAGYGRPSRPRSVLDRARNAVLPYESVEYLYTHRYESAVGTLYLGVDRAGVVHRVSYADFRDQIPDAAWEVNKYACGELEYQLDEYFAGKSLHFSLDVFFEGTSFQRAVWNRMRKIGYGSTMSYATLAQKIGRRDAAQAVGNAVGMNPAVIVVPCHRIITSSGDIGGYARRTMDGERGRRIKEQLLHLEGAL